VIENGEKYWSKGMEGWFPKVQMYILIIIVRPRHQFGGGM